MATIAHTTTDRLSAERKFYSRYALALTALVFLGFAPSFYLHNLFSYPRPNPTLTATVIAHGTLLTLWMLAFVAQTQLVAAGRRDLHIRLGQASFAMALAILPLMYLVSVWEVARNNAPPFTDPLNWSVVPLATIPVYAIMLWIGWSRRRQAPVHKRAMLGAALMLMHPAIGRLPLGPPLLAVFALTGTLSVATFVPLLLWDRRTLGRVHPVSLLGISLAGLSLAVQLAFLATGAWAPIARHLPGVGS
ncbi:MAG: hypothetical protein ABR588_01425 [Sphingomicrobium sp.]|nr:hypothetical protein [Sphingomonadales bacterium]